MNIVTDFSENEASYNEIDVSKIDKNDTYVSSLCAKAGRSASVILEIKITSNEKPRNDSDSVTTESVITKTGKTEITETRLNKSKFRNQAVIRRWTIVPWKPLPTWANFNLFQNF